MTIFYKFFLLAITIITIYNGCEKNQEKEYVPTYSDEAPFKNEIYIFGVHPLHNPKRLFEVYQPMVDYINARIKGAQLRLEASRNYPAYDKKLFAGYFHFSLPNPYQTVTSTKYGYNIFGKMGDDNNFRGIILVQKNGAIKTVNDLKGKTVSYPAPTALAATMMPQWYLYKHGLNINKDITNSYVGSQESSIMNVYLGKSAAASTWPPPWRAFIKERPEIAEKVMIKWETPPLPNNGLVVRKDVPKNILNQVSKIIFSLHTHEDGKNILDAMELSRYEVANYETYNPVREFLKHFELEVRPIRLSK